MASLYLPQFYTAITGTGSSTQALDASNDGAGAIFLAPKTGNISKIGVLYTAKTGTAPTYRIGLEGTTTTRQPNGTYKAATNAYVDAADPATGFTWHTLGSPAAVTVGDSLAATIRYQTGTINASNFVTVGLRLNAVLNGSLLPFGVALTAGTWSVDSAGSPLISAQYDDGTVVRMTCPYSSVANNAWASSDSPIYRGTKWTPAVTCRCIGIVTAIRLAANCDINVKIFEGATASPVATGSVNADETWGGSSTAYPGFIPVTPTTLTSGTVYRFVVEPSTVNATTTFVHAVHPDAASLAAFWGDLKGTTGTSTPTWTDYDNGTDGYRSYPVIPVIDDVTASGGAGPLVGPGRLIRF